MGDVVPLFGGPLGRRRAGSYASGVFTKDFALSEIASISLCTALTRLVKVLLMRFTGFIGTSFLALAFVLIKIADAGARIYIIH